MTMLQGDSESDIVVLKPANEEQRLDSMRLFAFGESGLGGVNEEGPSSDMDSSFMGSLIRRAGIISGKDNSSNATSVGLSKVPQCWDPSML